MIYGTNIELGTILDLNSFISAKLTIPHVLRTELGPLFHIYPFAGIPNSLYLVLYILLIKIKTFILIKPLLRLLIHSHQTRDKGD